MKNFKCIKLRINAAADDIIELPSYKGGILRSAFGNSFRKTLCITNLQTCNKCMIKDTCLYSYIFESPLCKQSKIFNKYSHVPHPFILTPPLDNARVYKSGECFNFEIVLVGDVIEKLPYFIHSIIKMGDMGIGKLRSRFHITSISNIDENYRESEIVFKDEKLFPVTKFLTFEKAQKIASEYTKDYIKMYFVTPVRIQFKGSLCESLNFEIFINNCFRRLTSLLYFYCNDNSPSYFKDEIQIDKNIHVVDNNLIWHNWDRYSARQKRRMKLGGLIGNICFKGDFKNIIPYLIACSWIHIGKGTTFGMGKYIIQV